MIVAGFAVLIFVCLAGVMLWRLAVFALPLWCGGATALWIYRVDSSMIFAALAGLTAAAAALLIGQLLLGFARSPLLRAGVGLAFAIPAASAGYHAGHGIAAHFMADGARVALLAMIAGASTGVASWGSVLQTGQRS